MASPRLLLVHGAWHGGWAWDPLLPLLAERGLAADVVELPSTGGAGDLTADAETVRSALAGDDPVVAVGHSYGGMVISEACAGAGNVAHLVYVCAFQLDVGESLLAAIGDTMPAWTEIDEGSRTSRVAPAAAPKVFYGDVDSELAAAWTDRLTTQTLSSFEQPLSAAAWRDIPSTYVACTEDRAIPYPGQQAMSAHAGTVQTLTCSHSPFASRPRELADLLASVAG
jgi:pimeloyl-ACP methyl ester carboxylesterase